MEIVDQKVEGIRREHEVGYMNQMYAMQEQLSGFHTRKINLESKLKALNAAVDTKLKYNRDQLGKKVQDQTKEFTEMTKENVEGSVSSLKEMGELEYNYEHMVSQIRKNKILEFDSLNKIMGETFNDEMIVC